MKSKNLSLYFTLLCVITFPVIAFVWTDVLNAAEMTDITRFNSRTNGISGKTVGGIADLGLREVNPFDHLDNSKIDTFPLSAQIELVKSVGLSSSECAEDTEIVVPSGTPVTYCFEITNTGTVDLGLHDLIDDHLGVLLDGLPFTLVSGASAFITQTAVIFTDTTNTAIWTAYNPGPVDEVTAEASASVWMATPEIEFTKTVGLSSSECAEDTEIVVPSGTPVTYCFEITNTGTVDLGLHDLIDDHLGVLLDGLNFTLVSGASAFITQTAVIFTDTTNTATWTAYNPGPVDVVTATASASVWMPAPEIELIKTVGLSSSECAEETEIVVPSGTPVTYCFEITNSGNFTLGKHNLIDDHLGVILDELSFDLQPGMSVFLTQTAVIETDTTNTATWTAYNPGPTDEVVATANATVMLPVDEYPLYLPLLIRSGSP